MHTTAADIIINTPDLRGLIDELESAWQKEQKKRHLFWAEIDENIKAEFINGEIIYHSPIYGRHWMASTNIMRYLLPFVKDHKLGKVAYEKVMIRCTRNDYEPDISFWPLNIASAFTPIQSAFPPPTFIIEILSDSTKDRDYGIKMTDYALHGVTEYWIVDTEHHEVEQYILENKTYHLSQKLKDGILESIAIPGFKIAINSIFED